MCRDLCSIDRPPPQKVFNRAASALTRHGRIDFDIVVAECNSKCISFMILATLMTIGGSFWKASPISDEIAPFVFWMSEKRPMKEKNAIRLSFREINNSHSLLSFRWNGHDHCLGHCEYFHCGIQYSNISSTKTSSYNSHDDSHFESHHSLTHRVGNSVVANIEVSLPHHRKTFNKRVTNRNKYHIRAFFSTLTTYHHRFLRLAFKQRGEMEVSSRPHLHFRQKSIRFQWNVSEKYCT
jgi:hypothetical protein